MSQDELAFDEVKGLYRVIPLRVLRRTPGVAFDLVPTEAFPRISGLDRVIHEGGAVSPGPVGEVARPWYMHRYQEDNLVVLHGVRYVDVYTPAHGKIESFTVEPQRVYRGRRSFLTARPCSSGRAACSTGSGGPKRWARPR